MSCDSLAGGRSEVDAEPWQAGVEDLQAMVREAMAIIRVGDQLVASEDMLRATEPELDTMSDRHSLASESAPTLLYDKMGVLMGGGRGGCCDKWG